MDITAKYYPSIDKQPMNIESIKWNMANTPKIEKLESSLANILERIELTNHEGTSNFREKLEVERDEIQEELAAIKATKPKF